MIYLTGDTHREFYGVAQFCRRFQTTKDDLLIILGDASINYMGGEHDKKLKKTLEDLPITILCVHGNHEKRPEKLAGYTAVPFHGGIVYREDYFPSLLFAKDGEVYWFDEFEKKVIVIGGAYSVDKHWRLADGRKWFEDEQPSMETKEYVESVLKDHDYAVDYVLSHTCPARYMPTEKFLPNISQAPVDRTTEDWLDTIESELAYKRWYCGHWHTDKTIDRMRFVFSDFIELGR